VKYIIGKMKSKRVQPGEFVLECIGQNGKRLVVADKEGRKHGLNIIPVQMLDKCIIDDIPLIVEVFDKAVGKRWNKNNSSKKEYARNNKFFAAFFSIVCFGFICLRC
jgi:hypothetical protein